MSAFRRSILANMIHNTKVLVSIDDCSVSATTSDIPVFDPPTLQSGKSYNISFDYSISNITQDGTGVQIVFSGSTTSYMTLVLYKGNAGVTYSKSVSRDFTATGSGAGSTLKIRPVGDSTGILVSLKNIILKEV